MQIRIKSDQTATSRLLNSVPCLIATELVGKVFDLADAKLGQGSYIVSVPYGKGIAHWNVPAECVEVVGE